MTNAAPNIDGEIDSSEWDAAGPWINATENSPNADFATNLIAGDLWDGDEDLSFRFKSMWVEETANFFLLYEVFDDIAMKADLTHVIFQPDHVVHQLWRLNSDYVRVSRCSRIQRIPKNTLFAERTMTSP